MGGRLKRMRQIMPVFTIAILTGFMIMLALQANRMAAASPSPTDQRYANLIDYINRLEKESASLEGEILGMRNGINRLQEQQSRDDYTKSELKRRLDELNDKAGYTEAKGAGIVVTLDDNIAGAEYAKKNHPNSYYPEDYIIHDTNLLYIVRALSLYSEAVAINKIRLGDSYNIRCVGTVIMVNSTRLAPPYEIEIIGDPSLLETTLLNCDEYQFLKSINMPVKYNKSDDLSLPAFLGSKSSSYAGAYKEQ